MFVDVTERVALRPSILTSNSCWSHHKTPGTIEELNDALMNALLGETKVRTSKSLVKGLVPPVLLVVSHLPMICSERLILSSFCRRRKNSAKIASMIKNDTFFIFLIFEVYGLGDM